LHYLKSIKRTHYYERDLCLSKHGGRTNERVFRKEDSPVFHEVLADILFFLQTDSLYGHQSLKKDVGTRQLKGVIAYQ
jgi:hypothetical protein